MENENVSIHHQPAQLNNPNMEIDNESWQREAEHSMRDWQHYRIKAAIAAMQAQLSSYETMNLIMQRLKEKGFNESEFFNTVASISMLYANALIEELQKKGGNND